MAIGLGFCMAPVWPTGFTLAGQSINLTGRLSGIILLGDSFGGMVLPTLVGQVIEGSGPRAMVYLVFGSLVLNLLAFTGMLRLRPVKPQPNFVRKKICLTGWRKPYSTRFTRRRFSIPTATASATLPGILQKLEYLQYLGVNAVWLNPCFASPFQDAGYDVSDFYRVAPRYGTNDDLRTLFDEARRLGLRILLDLVAGHTSTEHPWFKESCKHERNRYSDWYIWTDSVWKWSAPGVQMVVGYAERDGNYVTNFFHFQPALNYGFANPDPNQPWQQPVDAPGPQAVRQELKNIMKFWLDLGASGFRVDMAGSLVKNDPGGKETARLWQEVRAWLDREYPEAAIVSEWSNPTVAIPAGFHMDFLLPFASPGYRSLFRKPSQDAYSFFDPSGRGDIRIFLDEYLPLYQSTRDQGFIAIPSGNHDIAPRLGNGRTPRDLELAFLFLLTMPGVPFIYYGDEIGMRSLDGLPSKEGGYGRTGARTPMQWDDFTQRRFLHRSG